MKRNIVVVGLVMILSSILSFPAFANWEQAGTQWKYQNADGSYIMNQWVWLDGDNNGVAECYYLDANGVMAVNTVVDSYTVNESGAWVVNGVVQTKVVGSGGQTSTNNSGFTVPPLSSGNVGGLDWTAECGDSTGLPPMQ